MKIREAEIRDLEELYSLFQQVIAQGDVYVFYSDTSLDAFTDYWFAPQNHVYLAEVNDQVAGSFFIRPNQPDRGSHMANASYMVHQKYRGQGIGDQLCKHSLAMAKAHGFESI